MESLLAPYLFDRYTLLVSSTCAQVPFGWWSDVEALLQTLEALPTAVRSYLMVAGIRIDDQTGMLTVELIAAFELMSDGGEERIRDAVKAAQDCVSKLCVDCGARGVAVRAREGMRVLCLECQDKRGISCHEV